MIRGEGLFDAKSQGKKRATPSRRQQPSGTRQACVQYTQIYVLAVRVVGARDDG